MKPERNEQLSTKRKKCGFTQEEVAKAVGISTRYYKYLEAGKRKPNVETAISIAKLLKCEVPDLFDPSQRQPGDDEPQPDYSNNEHSGVEAAKELEEAHSNFKMDVCTIADIIDNRRLDCQEKREAAAWLRDKLNQVLEGNVA